MRMLLRIAVWLLTCVPLLGSLAAAPLPRSVLIIDQYGPCHFLPEFPPAYGQL